MRRGLVLPIHHIRREKCRNRNTSHFWTPKNRILITFCEKEGGGSGTNLTETLADIVCDTGRGLFENTYHITLFFKWPVGPKLKLLK